MAILARETLHVNPFLEFQKVNYKNRLNVRSEVRTPCALKDPLEDKNSARNLPQKFRD